MREIDEAERKRVRAAWRTATPKTPAELVTFFEELNAYKHDYSTICHALGAGAVAATRMLDAWLKQGGITGFQAGFVMWEFISGWMHKDDEPMRLVSFQNMLYPQYAREFEKTIEPDTWKWLQKEARKRLAKGGAPASDNVRRHWESIVAGVVPFGYAVKERQ